MRRYGRDSNLRRRLSWLIGIRGEDDVLARVGGDSRKEARGATAAAMPAHIRVALLAALLMLAVYTAFAAIRERLKYAKIPSKLQQ